MVLYPQNAQLQNPGSCQGASICEGYFKSQNASTYMIKVCNVAAQATQGLAPPVLRLIAKKHVAGPEFGITEGGELGSIQPEH